MNVGTKVRVIGPLDDYDADRGIEIGDEGTITPNMLNDGLVRVENHRTGRTGAMNPWQLEAAEFQA